MADAIGETRAVARQGSSQHDEMDGWPGVWTSGRGWSQDFETSTALYLDRRTETELGGFGLRAGLGTVSQRESAGVVTP